jgi:phosphoribosylformimino-5-aminoimidazole carboxamide ribotide isomerase
VLILPAIDLSQGQVVRLRRGEMNQKTVYSDDPAAMARRWEAEGGQVLHVVDLDGAFTGSSTNLAAVRGILDAVSIPVELGGGLRTRDDVARVLDLGVQWAIMGTSALHDRPALEAALAEFADRVIVGIDARDGFVAVEGWVEASQTTAVDLAREMEKLGVSRLICTDIATDGMLQGPNIESLRAIAGAVATPLIASGGVTSIADITALRAIEAEGIVGAIIGQALYTGAISLRDAVAAGE